jgi:uncharacterized membrane protein YozB (DUF420 family)
MNLAELPAVNATLNGLSAILLGLGFFFIRRKRQTAHRNCMIAAVCSSTLFLACYLTYHLTVKTITHFRDPSWFRPIYLTILLTHTLLAVTILPLVFVTLSRAIRGRFEAHRKIARWTWPLWMYVSVTGVVIYLLLYRIFPQHG